MFVDRGVMCFLTWVLLCFVDRGVLLMEASAVDRGIWLLTEAFGGC